MGLASRGKTYVHFAEFAVGHEATANIILGIVTNSTNGFICSERTAEDVRGSLFSEARDILDIGRQALFIIVLCNWITSCEQLDSLSGSSRYH